MLKDTLIQSKKRADTAEDGYRKLEDVFKKFDEQLSEKIKTISSLEEKLQNMEILLQDKETPKKQSPPSTLEVTQ